MRAYVKKGMHFKSPLWCIREWASKKTKGERDNALLFFANPIDGQFETSLTVVICFGFVN